MKSPVFFNAHHAPVGAFATFTLGAKGKAGGLANGMGMPAGQNVFIGVERPSGSIFDCLPFFEPVEDESVRFAPEARRMANRKILRIVPDRAIRRSFSLHADTWHWSGASFSVFPPSMGAPDPETASAQFLRLAYAPLIPVEIHVDNTSGRRPRRFFFGFQNENPERSMRRLHPVGAGPEGVAASNALALVSVDAGVQAIQSFTVEDALVGHSAWNRGFGLGPVGLLTGAVPAGQSRTFRFLAAFHRAGVVTSGLRASFYYTRFFPTLESLVAYGIKHYAALRRRGLALERRLAAAALPPERRWMLNHAILSYFGSTQLLDVDSRPLWIVNEGEYRMINTLDLTADHAFFEAELHPWALRNVLDFFLRRYAYTDRLHVCSGRPTIPGGISFAHDMGLNNHFAPPGRSIYEKEGTSGCFSHMTCEQLVNWVHCALLAGQEHPRWLRRQLPVLTACLRSLVRRDAVRPAERDGIMSLDSARCAGGAEITTYDSLDSSLGQARGNLYLGGRTWAVYLGLARVFDTHREHVPARLAADQAARAARTIAAAAAPDGTLPALLGDDPPSRIIPVIEGLALIDALGLQPVLRQSPHAECLRALDCHLRTVLASGVCRFPDGGWKLSATSDNSWLSKIYLCQSAAERVLGHPRDARADRAHQAWLLRPENLRFAWSDQMIRGVASGSKYYPRGVTAWRWLIPRTRRPGP